MCLLRRLPNRANLIVKFIVCRYLSPCKTFMHQIVVFPQHIVTKLIAS
jgi:hypothetical protein